MTPEEKDAAEAAVLGAVERLLKRHIGKPIGKRFFEMLERTVIEVTGRAAWCDQTNNPPHLAAQGTVRIVWQLPDWTITVATIRG